MKFYIGVIGREGPGMASPDIDGSYPTAEAAERQISAICERNLFWQGRLEVRERSLANA